MNGIEFTKTLFAVKPEKAVAVTVVGAAVALSTMDSRAKRNAATLLGVV